MSAFGYSNEYPPKDTSTEISFRWNSFFALVGSSRFELPTSRLSGARSNQLSYEPISSFPVVGGDEGIRTLDPLLAGQVLSQLSYTPIFRGSLERAFKIEQQDETRFCRDFCFF